MRKILPYFMIGLIMPYGCGDPGTTKLTDGDIIFQTSRSVQSKAIQKATHSRYSHVGIIFLRKGKPYVFEARKTVQYTPLNEWISRGQGGHYVVKRLRDAKKVLNPQAIGKLRAAAERFRGKPYDVTFGWSDDRIYCSELVWKIYDRGLGKQIGRLQKLGDFDLSDGVVKTTMRQRYGNRVPLGETVVSPEGIFSSGALTTVAEHGG